ncbi:MAG: DNA polymerase III subunit gamma/tau, partial [Tissierellia bacterium]|nr:DNA polymerase III subunit gamma/tau [Tissierellia bacterium]
MSQALYRKYRPKTFDEVYGQANIVNILKNQIQNEKISHAYLFSGSRGTGKTSCAKIFSRAVNCLNPVGGNPCNQCSNCKAILEESSMDVIEMDAASNRRIDDIRQLRDTVIYPPTDLKFKVYIIDEAHMITNEGFNALLKIMEEPPKHLIFILATTEVDKIPDTILSRTQRFEFKKIEDQVIEERINDILKKESIKMDQDAINTISNIGKGSMRDALSTLDQVISMNKDEFKLEDINDILGIVGRDVKMGIYRAVVEGDLANLIFLLDEELKKGKDSHNIIKEMIAFVESLLDYKIGQMKDDLASDFYNFLDSLSLEYIVNSLDILVDYELKIRKSDNRNLLLKMSMIRLVDNTPRDVLLSRIKALEDRISRLENGSIKPAKRELNGERSSKPVSISHGNPFEKLKEELEDEKKIQDEKEIQ